MPYAPQAVGTAKALIDDLTAAGYRAFLATYQGRYEIVVEGQAGRLSASAPRPVSASITTDSSAVGRLVGIGEGPYDDLYAVGAPAIRSLLLVTEV
jgi:hypothetical protein